MSYKYMSPCINTKNIDKSRDFYLKYFNAKVIFDCGWYLNLRFSNAVSAIELCFMSPQNELCKYFSGEGLTYNFQVDNVDLEFERLSGKGLIPVVPLNNHPWGDRGFAVQDPNGIIIYIFTPIEPDGEFKKFYKENK
ncbi:MAG: VOC family protein [Candidatus Omnitrophota bacterium]